jgi:hypothetical protein
MASGIWNYRNNSMLTGIKYLVQPFLFTSCKSTKEFLSKIFGSLNPWELVDATSLFHTKQYNSRKYIKLVFATKSLFLQCFTILPTHILLLDEIHVDPTKSYWYCCLFSETCDHIKHFISAQYDEIMNPKKKYIIRSLNSKLLFREN